MRTLRTFWFVLGILIVAISVAGAAEYYVAPDGHDANPGTKDAPWATLATVSAQARAGDTVIFLPGVYHGILNPAHSGTAEAPITFRAAQRRTVKLVGQAGAPFTVRLDGVSHITIEGMHMDSATTMSGWLEIKQSTHIVLRDSLLENSATQGMPFVISNCDHIFLQDNEIRRWAPDWELTNQIQVDMFRIEGARHVVLEGNSISHALHTAIAFRPQSEGRNEYIVLRGNVLHNGWGRNYEFFGTNFVLFEDNLVTNAFAGARSADTQSKFGAERGIFRFNGVHTNWGGSDVFTADWVDASASHMRVYNNVFAANSDFGVKAASRAKGGERLFVNNAIVGNDAQGTHTQAVYTPTDANLRFMHNLIWSDQVDVLPQLSAPLFQQTIVADPQFIAAGSGNFIPSAASPLRNAGKALTEAVGNGAGNTLKVHDAAYFYDGFGISGEQGDLIAVGSPSQVARILHVDYASNLLTLDRSVTWQDGDAVSLRWTGSAPDIGLYQQGRPFVQVEVSAEVVPLGEPLALAVDLHGIEPTTIQWQLGDGTIYSGASLTHTYAAAGDYAIRVKVIDVSGSTHFGTGLAVVQQVEPDRLNQPLLAFNFDAEDAEWWRFWKAYRPFPAQWSRVFDRTTGDGYLKIDAPRPDPGIMPAWIYPVGWHLNGPLYWDVDAYPYVYLRYRIAPGTPVALYAQGFAGASGRQAILASARTHKDASVPKALNQVLFDDGQWHELTVDVRVVRDIYGDLNALQGIGLQTALDAPTNSGNYDISEFGILPASHQVSNKQLAVAQPKEFARISGTVPVKYVIAGFAADESVVVTMEMGGRVLAESVHAVDEVVIDTTQVGDGEHVLNIQAATSRGEKFASTVWVEVHNRWFEVDDLQKSSYLFGELIDRTKTSARSTGWSYDEMNANDFFGDVDRLVRIDNTTEFLEWSAQHLIEVTFELYTKLHVADLAPLVEITGSQDRGEWQLLRRRIAEAGRSAAGWRKVTITGTVPSGAGMNWVRLTLLADTVPPGDIQVGRVSLSGWLTQP